MKKFIAMSAALVMLGTAGHAAADAAAGKTKAAACAACHSADGNSAINPEWPKLAGQHASYIAKQLADFKAGTTRNNVLMTSQVVALSEKDMQDIGDYFATQTTSIGSADQEKLALGEKLYRGGNSDTGVPACMACHGPSGAGNAAAKFPSLSGQHSVYAANQLKAFRSGARSNDMNNMMSDVAAKMSDAEIDAVAAYMSGLH